MRQCRRLDCLLLLAAVLCFWAHVRLLLVLGFRSTAGDCECKSFTVAAVAACVDVAVVEVGQSIEIQVL